MNRAKHAEINHLTILDFYLDLFARGTYSISNRARLDSDRFQNVSEFRDNEMTILIYQVLSRHDLRCARGEFLSYC